MKKMLTDRELDVLVYMKEFFRSEDMLPTLDMIAQHSGYTAPSGALNLCRSLQKKGYIERNQLGKWRFARQGAGA